MLSRIRSRLPVSVLGIVAAALMAGCGSETMVAPQPGGPEKGTVETADIGITTSALITDQTNGAGTTGFYWVQPIVTSAAPFTTLDTTGSSNALTVKVDLANPNGTYTNKASFTTSTTPAIVVKTATDATNFPGTPAPFYGVTWTPSTAVKTGERYRLRVQVGTTPVREIGVADVMVYENATDAGGADRTKFATMLAGGTLKVTFRLESKDNDGDGVKNWKDNCPGTSNATQTDTLKNGKGDACRCVGVTCVADSCHPAGTCSATAGCPVKTGSCDDGNRCTSSDTCTAGVCKGSALNSGMCNDNNACTSGDVCTAGVCTGTSLTNTTTVCTDGNSCTQTDQCKAGWCLGASPKASNATCDDGNACTTGEVCTGGQCAGGVAVATDDFNPCTADSCSVAGGVSHAPLSGISCDDGNRCSVGDSCSAGTCVPGPATGCQGVGQTAYVPVVDLGSTQGYSYATDINNAGVIVGVDRPDASIYAGPGAMLGFRWTQAGGFTYLPNAGPNTYPMAINDDGVVAGISGLDLSTQWLRAFRYDPRTDTQIQRLAEGPANAVNRTGIVAGHAYLPTGLHMFRGTTAADVQDLPGMNRTGYTGVTQGWAIDDNGTVVGEAQKIDPAGNIMVAARYSTARGIELLNDFLPAGSTWDLRAGRGIHSTNGMIVGYGYVNGLGRAFRMQVAADGTLTKLDNLGIPSNYAPTTTDGVSIAMDINTAGAIVGGVYDPSRFWPGDAFVYADSLGGIVNLNSLIDPASGWQLAVAFAINDVGDAVGMGYHNGHRRAFKMRLGDLSPCPAATDACVGIVTRNAQTGVCEAVTPLGDGAVCSQGNACSMAGVCLGGVCQPPQPLEIDDGDANTVDACDPATGAVTHSVGAQEFVAAGDRLCIRYDLQRNCLQWLVCEPSSSGEWSPCTVPMCGFSISNLMSTTMVATGPVCRLGSQGPCETGSPDCKRLSCPGGGQICSGIETIDMARAEPHMPSADVVDLGPDLFAVGYIEQGSARVRYKNFSVKSGGIGASFAVLGNGLPNSIPAVRGASSHAVFKPDAFCASDQTNGHCYNSSGVEGVCSAWGTYTNFFTIQENGKIYLDIHRACSDGRPSYFSRVLMGSTVAGGNTKDSSSPAVAATPEGIVNVVWGNQMMNARSLASRFLLEPPGKDGKGAILGALQEIGGGVGGYGQSRRVSIAYNSVLSNFAIGTLAQEIGTGLSSGTGIVPLSAINRFSKYNSWGSPGDGDSGGHYSSIASNPRFGDGKSFFEWSIRMLGPTVSLCKKGLDLESAEFGVSFATSRFCTESPASGPLVAAYSYTTPVSETYEGSSVAYVFASQSDLDDAGHLYGVRADGSYALLDPSGAAGFDGFPYGVKSLREATAVVVVKQNVVSIVLSPWHNP